MRTLICTESVNGKHLIEPAVKALGIADLQLKLAMEFDTTRHGFFILRIDVPNEHSTAVCTVLENLKRAHPDRVNILAWFPL